MDKRLLIAQPVATELEKFNSYYAESIFCENARIQEIIDYVMKSDGKRIRPILLLLAAKASGEINNETYNSAITVELLHTASLIHDDVVDESSLRRGKASLNAIYDNKMAVLAGDYFLSTALMKSILTGNIEVISILSSLGRTLAEGELNQLMLARNSILNEEEYFGVIRKKTASLLSSCMRIGAMTAGGTADDIDKFSHLGELLGICFQLRDDIFDYFANNVGKPTGNDIREGKVTLPLLFALRNAPKEVQNKFFTIIRSYDFTDENVATLISFAKDNGGIEYAYSKIEEYRNEAIIVIDTVENKDIKTALLNILDYIVERSF